MLHYSENNYILKEFFTNITEFITNAFYNIAYKAHNLFISSEQKRISEADDHWKELSAELEKFYREHAGLRELIRESVPQNGE